MPSFQLVQHTVVSGHFVPDYSLLKLYPMGHTNLQELYCCQQQLNSVIDRREDNLFKSKQQHTNTKKNDWVIEILPSNLCILSNATRTTDYGQ